MSLLLVLQAGGLLFYYEVEQAVVHYRQHRALTQHRFVQDVLVMSEDQYLQQREGEDELQVQGRIYDVLAVKKVNSTMYITAVRDKEEEDVLHRIAALVGGLQQQQSTVPDVLMKLLSFVYLLPDVYSVPPLFGSPQQVYAPFTVLLSDRHLSVVPPPPDPASC